YSLLCERGHVDYETVFHVGFEHALERLVDFLNGNDFDVRYDVVFGAVIEHLLRLRHAADDGAGERAALEEQVTHADDGRSVRQSNLTIGSVTLEQRQIAVEVMRSGYGVEDEVEGVGLFLHGGFVFRDDDLVGSEAFGVGDL